MTSFKQQQLIHYTEYPGAEPAIVFVHGFTCDETDWACQVKHFGVVGQRIITLDLPGHGKSMSCNTSTFTMKAMGSEVVTMLHHLQVKSTIVVGHSMGTMIAAEIATQAPNMVIGIALIDGSRIAKGNPEEAVASSNARFEQMAFTRCVTDIFEPMFLPGSDEKEKSTSSTAHVHSLNAHRSNLIICHRWCAEDFEYKYSQLKVPVQVVQSTHRGEGNKRVSVTSDMHIEWTHDTWCGCRI